MLFQLAMIFQSAFCGHPNALDSVRTLTRPLSISLSDTAYHSRRRSARVICEKARFFAPQSDSEREGKGNTHTHPSERRTEGVLKATEGKAAHLRTGLRGRAPLLGGLIWFMRLVRSRGKVLSRRIPPPPIASPTAGRLCICSRSQGRGTSPRPGNRSQFSPPSAALAALRCAGLRIKPAV